MDTSEVLGMGACIMASTLTPLGLILQKYSHAQSQKVSSDVAFYRQPWWIAGMAVFLCGHVLNIISTGMAPQVMLSCLGTWAIIPNAVFAWLILSERLSSPQLLYMAVMVAAMMMVILGTPSASASEQGVIHADVLAAMFLGTGFLTLSVVLSGVLAAARFATLGVAGNMQAGFWVFLATTLSGFATTICKCVSLLATHSAPSAYLSSPYFYCMVSAGALLSGLMLHCVNMGLQEGDALIIVPMYYALGMLFQIIVAGVFFDELDSFSNAGQALGFTSGVVVLLLCIGALPFAQVGRPRSSSIDKETEEELLAIS